MSHVQPDTAPLVRYVLTKGDAEVIEHQRRTRGVVGNPVSEGDDYPALIVRRWSPGTANIRVLLDGPDDYWATSRTATKSPEAGHWYRPEAE
jgi:hypothetical protein